MAMKTLSSPRRVYLRNGVVHTLYGGLIFGTKGETKISIEQPVRIEGDGNGGIRVTQRVGHRKAVTETWSEVRVPCVPRAS